MARRLEVKEDNVWVLRVCGQDGWMARGNKWMPCYHEPRKALGISMLSQND